MDLELVGGAEWQGWSIQGEFIYAPEWRGGLGPGHIRSLPYLMQISSEMRRQEREFAAVRQQLAAVTRLCGWYRRQLVLESRAGLALIQLLT
jgi:hypothetical protein